MTQEKRTRRGAVPFSERLAAIEARLARARTVVIRIEAERVDLLVAERAKADAILAALPPEVAMGSKRDSPDE